MQKFGKTCKEYIINEMAERLKDYPDFFITSFSKVGVGNTEKFRKSLKKDSTSYVVVKNSLLKRAIESAEKDIDAEKVKALVTGSCGVLFSKGDPCTAARSLVDFGKGNEAIKIQGGFMDGEIISADIIKQLAMLPPREALLSMVASGVKAPISGFVGLLGNLLRNLLNVIDAISKKKGESQN